MDSIGEICSIFSDKNIFVNYLPKDNSMVLRQIVAPTNQNRFIWLNAFALLAFLISGMVDPFAIVMVYFLETFIIGILHVYKMIVVKNKGKTQNRIKNNTQPAGFKIGFFFVHYSFFIAVQSIFVFAIFSIADNNIKEPFNLLENYSYAISLKGIGYAMLIMFITLAVQTYFSFIKPKMYNFETLEGMFLKPYLRIFIQQFTVIIAMFFIAFFPDGIMVAVLLILFRLFIDLVIVFISSSEGNLKKMASRLAKKSDQDEREVYEELKKLF